MTAAMNCGPPNSRPRRGSWPPGEILARRMSEAQTSRATSARSTGNSSVSNQGLRLSHALFRQEGSALASPADACRNDRHRATC